MPEHTRSSGRGAAAWTTRAGGKALAPSSSELDTDKIVPQTEPTTRKGSKRRIGDKGKASMAPKASKPTKAAAKKKKTVDTGTPSTTRAATPLEAAVDAITPLETDSH